jgi:hypothetical protein
VPPSRRKPTAAVGTHQVQAAVEGVEIVGDARKVPFMGAEFRMADRIGLMPLMHLAVASKKGVDAADMEGLVAMYEVIRDCVDVSEWPRFERHAVDMKAEADDLMKVVQHVIEAISARPTSPPGGLSTGRRTTSANSKGSSSKTAMGEPDDGMTSVDSLLGR